MAAVLRLLATASLLLVPAHAQTPSPTSSSFIFPTFLAYTYNQVYNITSDNFVYSVVSFSQAIQYELPVRGPGIYQNGFHTFPDPVLLMADATCSSGYSWSIVRYLEGTSACGTATRATNVTLSCGSPTALTSAGSTGGCQYQIDMNVDCSQNSAVPG